jgi:hypothetical protein
MKLKNAGFALAILFCVSMTYAQVTGSGTDHTIPIWSGTTTLGDSPIVSDKGRVGVGTKNLDAQLTVVTTSTTVPAVLGISSATSGSTGGVVGTAASPNGNACSASTMPPRDFHRELWASLTVPQARVSTDTTPPTPATAAQSKDR